MKRGCRICPTAIFFSFLDFPKRRRTEVPTGNGDEVEEEVSRGRRRECEVTARVRAVNVSQSLKRSNVADHFK